MAQRTSVKDLILVPSIITLAVTLVRLAGELMGGSALLFNSEAGGAGALVGIAWLVPILGVYFAWKLIQEAPPSASPWKTLGLAVAAFACIILGAVIAGGIFGVDGLGPIFGTMIGGLLAIYVCRYGWRELYDVLLAYALAARIPVAIIMLIAMLGDWQTHYDLPPPGFPEMNVFLKWILIGLIPQLTIWIAYTLAVGFIFAVPVMLFKGRQSSVVGT